MFGKYGSDKSSYLVYDHISKCSMNKDFECLEILAFIFTFEKNFLNYDLGFGIAKKLAGFKNGRGLALLGYYYYNGLKVDKNEKKGFFFFKSFLKSGSEKKRCEWTICDWYYSWHGETMGGY